MLEEDELTDELDKDELDDALETFLSLSLLSHPVNNRMLRQDAMSNDFFSI